MPAVQTKTINFERNFIDKYINTGNYHSPLPGMPGGPPMATGGLVVGPGTGTSDDVAARLSNGEYVIKESQVRALGVQFFDAINSGAYKRYAEGGYVQKYEATPLPANLPLPAQQEPRIVYEQPVTFHQHVVQDPYAQSALDSAKVRHATIGLLRRGGML